VEIENKMRARVRWQDGSRDTSWEIDPANRGEIEEPEFANLRAERYRERTGKSYQQWAASNEASFDEDGIPTDVFDPNSISDAAYQEPFGPSNGPAQPSGERILLEEALKLLTEKQRYIWELAMVKALSYEQIGACMAISKQTVHEQLASSKKKVAEYLDANRDRIKARADE
jgi:RNA polymerase sigma factor (sigma-70 family)